MKVIRLFIILFFFILFFVFPIFSGEHFCYFPWVEDKGPGTIGCFYSASNQDVIRGKKLNYLL